MPTQAHCCILVINVVGLQKDKRLFQWWAAARITLTTIYVSLRCLCDSRDGMPCLRSKYASRDSCLAIPSIAQTIERQSGRPCLRMNESQALLLMSRLAFTLLALLAIARHKTAKIAVPKVPQLVDVSAHVWKFRIAKCRRARRLI